MSEEKVTYAELNLSKTKKQNDKNHPPHKGREFPRHFTTGSLGILCFFILMAIAGLGYMFFWRFHKNKNVSGSKGNGTSSTEVDTPTSSPTHTGKVCHIHYERWSCCGRSCYYFSTEEKTWDESKTSCQNLGSNLIKIEDEEELMLIHSKVKFSAWVGLHAKGGSHLWTWQDGSSLSGNLTIQMTTSSSDALCGRLKRNNIINDVCTKEFYYICEM